MSTLEFVNSLLPMVRSGGFDEAEAILTIDAMTEMQIDAGEVSLLRKTENSELTLRGIACGRYASITINQLDEGSVATGIEQLREAAESAPVDPARAFAEGRGAERITNDYGPTEPALDQMYERISGFMTTVARRHPEVKMEQSTLQFDRSRQLRANTVGLFVDESEGVYSAMAMFSSKRGDKTSSFNYSGASSGDLHRELIQWGAIERSLESSVKEVDHVPLTGKFTGDVVLSPDCFFEVIGSWLSHLRDERLIAGTSRLSDKLGQQVASPHFTLRVDPANREFSRREFTTGDGYRSEPSTIIENGVLKSFMLTDYGARKTGLTRAKNAAMNRVVEAGPLSAKDLMGSVKRGILLGRFSGGSPSANGDFSGVAKNSYLIEDGRVAKPVSEVMISGNLFSVMNAITGVSTERVNDGMTLTPWVAVSGLTITGQT